MVSLLLFSLFAVFCKWTGIAFEVFSGTTDFLFLATSWCLLAHVKSFKQMRRGTRIAVILLCFVVPSGLSVLPAFDILGTYYDAVHQRVWSEDPGFCTVAHLAVLCVAALFVVISAAIAAFQWWTTRKLPQSAAGTPKKAKASVNADAGHHVRAPFWSADTIDEDEDDATSEDSPAAAGTIDDDDLLHASRSYARHRSHRNRGKLLWSWNLTYLAFCVPDVLDFIWPKVPAIGIICAVSLCYGLALFIAFCVVNIEPMGESCCAPGRLGPRFSNQPSHKRGSLKPLIPESPKEATFVHSSAKNLLEDQAKQRKDQTVAVASVPVPEPEPAPATESSTPTEVKPQQVASMPPR